MDIFIQRVYCKHCKKTHSILPRFIIPYEREPFDYVLDLVLEFKDKEISKVDYQLVRTWKLLGCWCTSVSKGDYSHDSNDKQMISANIEYDKAWVDTTDID